MASLTVTQPNPMQQVILNSVSAMQRVNQEREKSSAAMKAALDSASENVRKLAEEIAKLEGQQVTQEAQYQQEIRLLKESHNAELKVLKERIAAVDKELALLFHKTKHHVHPAPTCPPSNP